MPIPETTWTADELEVERQRVLKDASEIDGDPGPGSLWCHEVLHMTSFLAASVDRELCEHLSIAADPEWFRLAMEAQQKLADLYQAIGAVHLSADDPNRPSDAVPHHTTG